MREFIVGFLSVSIRNYATEKENHEVKVTRQSHVINFWKIHSELSETINKLCILINNHANKKKIMKLK